jgi:DNA-directed RNA polymerase subunit RPC12/RpoP
VADETDDPADAAETYTCDNCGAETTREGTVRTETVGDLDPSAWQTLCCPDCGARLKTVFVGDE